MKLWDKGMITDKKVDQFTVGEDRVFDLVLAKYDIKGSLAHAEMLSEIGLLTKDEFQALSNALNSIMVTIQNGDFVISDDFEDVHSKIESLLIDQLGEVGKKIHTARSRNDQVLVDMHLYLKDECADLTVLTKELFDLLMELAERYKEDLLPGYTHLQVAMPSSFGMWFSAYGESLIDDQYMLNAAQKIIDQNPLGSGAGYGSSFPIDRTLTTQLLGFETLKYNSVAAQMGRGKMEKNLAFAMASLSGTLSKFSMDICLYLNQNFDFISFPDALTTGSSIMPHKKNPDVFELIRGKCNRIQALPNELILLTNNLPSGYHREMQLIKEGLFPAIQSLKSCLEMLIFSLKQIEVKQSILEDEKYKYLFTVERTNELVLQGIAFRDAYRIVGEEIVSGTFRYSGTINHSHEGSIGNLNLSEIKEKMERAIG